MKKRIITLLLALACCIPLMAACDTTEGSDESGDTTDATTTQPTIITGTITNWKVPTPEKGSDGLYKIIVNDFERPADISPLIAGQVNTAASVEKKIVHAGNQSLKIRYTPEDAGYKEANLRQPMNLVHRKDYSSFKTVKKISFWVYNDNAQTKEEDITISIAYKGETPAFYYTQTIPAKEWTEVTLDLTNATVWYYKNNVKTTANVTTLLNTSKAVERLTFSFMRASTVKDTVFYIDDVCLHSTVPM
jgi:hypothetical protein